jgi:hypothetical protein
MEACSPVLPSSPEIRETVFWPTVRSPNNRSRVSGKKAKVKRA